jgi:hypothetical protein
MNLQASLTSGGTTALPTRTISADTHSDLTLADISPPLSASDQGERISGTGIAPGTTIAQVGSGGTSATLSVATNATNNDVGITVGVGTVAGTVNAPVMGPNQNPPITAISPPLTQADFGHVVLGTGIAPGTTIMGITNDGTGAYLSSGPTSAATGSSSTITIADAVPVPMGTYTVTVVSNGTLAAWPADTSYTQSVLSSGATFTVSDF